MIHTIVYYVGNFIPDGLVLHKFTTMDPSGIKFPAGWHFYYIEKTNSHASVYYMNYMGMCYSHQYIKMHTLGENYSPHHSHVPWEKTIPITTYTIFRYLNKLYRNIIPYGLEEWE